MTLGQIIQQKGILKWPNKFEIKLNYEYKNDRA